MLTVILIVIGSVIVLFLLVIALLYNRLVRLRNKTDKAWKQIDVELTRRHDLVPELAEVVKGYAGHESTTFERVADSRSKAISAGTVGEKATAEDGLTGALGGLFAVAERYPDLKANEEYLKFGKQLAATENRIAGSRKYYNGSVMQYDNARQSFPGNVVARAFARSFPDREYFEIEDTADRAVPSAG